MTTFQIGTVILAGLAAFLVYVAYDMRRATREALHTLGVDACGFSPSCWETDGGENVDADTLNDLGPRVWRTHGPRAKRGTRGSLPDSQEGSHGGRDSRSFVVARTERRDDE